MADFIAVVVLAVIIGAAAGYIYREKKRGVRCVGCPDAGSCCAHHHGQDAEAGSAGCGSNAGSGCCCHTDENC